MADQSLAYENTTVSVSSSIGHIRDLCERYGATAFRQSEDFELQAFEVEMHLGGVPLRLRVSYAGYAEIMRRRHKQTPMDVLEKRAAKCAWRWAYWMLKLVFEGDTLGFQDKAVALLAGFVGPNGLTLGETVAPRLAEWHEQGARMLALPAARGLEEGKFE